MSFLDSLFGGKTKSGIKNAHSAANAESSQINKGSQYLQQGQTSAIGALDAGQTGALSAYQPYAAAGTDALTNYQNLINNPDSIYNSELYKGQQAAGLDAINRGANARGMLASGNNTQDLIDYMRKGGLDYFNTLTSAYQPLLSAGMGAASGMAGVYTGTGVNKANVYTGTAEALNQNQNNLGQVQAQMFGNINAAQQAAPSWGDILLGVGGGLTNAASKAGGFGSLFGIR